jgi:hypothetical protein
MTDNLYEVETIEVVRRTYRVAARDPQEAEETVMGGYVPAVTVKSEPVRMDSYVNKGEIE